jgi:uncharacterized protein (UPF0332 family)
MNFDWNTYIDLAKTLNAMRDESAQRSAVSRAYYGAFHAASITLRTNGVLTFPQDARKSHAKIWNVYKKSQSTNCRRVGVKCGRFMDLRHDADYDATVSFHAADVGIIINDVENAVVDLATHVPEGYTGPTTLPNNLNQFLARLKKALGL